MRYKALYQLRWIVIPPIRFDGFYDDISNFIFFHFLPTFKTVSLLKIDGLWGWLGSCPFLCLWKGIGVTQIGMLKVVK